MRESAQQFERNISPEDVRIAQEFLDACTYPMSAEERAEFLSKDGENRTRGIKDRRTEIPPAAVASAERFVESVDACGPGSIAANLRGAGYDVTDEDIRALRERVAEVSSFLRGRKE